MGFLLRCPLTGITCGKPITIRENVFFLAEMEKPDEDRKRRHMALSQALDGKFDVKSALDEKGLNAFTCKICEMIQSCSYGIADISDNNPNVLFELGIMIALGKPTVILYKKEKDLSLKLPSDLNSIEVIPFSEYIDIIEPLKKLLQILPDCPVPPNPIESINKLDPKVADSLKSEFEKITKEFAEAMKKAHLDIISIKEEKFKIIPELDERIYSLEGRLKELSKLGLTADASTAFLRGNFYYNQGKYKEALEAYNWSLELEPNVAATVNNRGVVLLELGRYDEALVDNNHALKLTPDDTNVLINRGIAFTNLCQYENALADFNLSLKIKPCNPIALINRGNTYYMLQRYDDSLVDQTRAIELKPDEATAFLNRGSSYLAMERYNEALVDFNRALEMIPENSGYLKTVLIQRSNTYHVLKRYEEALIDYNRLIVLLPDNSDVLINRGNTHYILKRYNEALADYNRSVELTPNNTETLYNMICLFFLIGKTDEAIGFLNKALNKIKKE